MDTSYLNNWNVQEQQLRADFMTHMYDCSGRTNGVYTGLWQEFCLKEAGPYCRTMWFEQQEAIKKFIAAETAKTHQDVFIPTLHD